MSALWTAAEAAAATGGRAQGDWAVTGIDYDSRALRPGALFVALTAARDGHDFVRAALDAGAAAAMVSRVPEGCEDAPLLIVPDVLAGLEALARAARTRSRAKVLAITGSVGKTSTKDMAAVALAGQGAVHAAEASLNNHWGVPLTLARMPAATDWAILELGMNHPGEIAPLARLARPDAALITTIGAAHMAAFGGLEGIAEEKASIFQGLVPGGPAIIPEGLSTSALLRARAGARVIGFGTEGEARLLAARTEDGATQVEAEIAGQPVAFTLASAGTHFALNAVGVLAALSALGADLPRAAAALGAWRPYKGRGGVERLANGATLLDDSYNANPTSLRAGLETLARLPEGRRVAILGDMLELGEDEIDQHRAIACWGEVAALDTVHTCGPRMGALWEALPEAQRGLRADTAEALIAQAPALARPGDVVFVKGSKGSRVAAVVDALRGLRSGAADRKED